MNKIAGLSQAEAQKRLDQYGLNQVPEVPFSFWKEFAGKLWNLSAWILEAALLLECLLGKWIQSGFVLLMLLFAAYNGASQKKKSRKVLSQISQELTPQVAVCRWQLAKAGLQVPGTWRLSQLKARGHLSRRRPNPRRQINLR